MGTQHHSHGLKNHGLTLFSTTVPNPVWGKWSPSNATQRGTIRRWRRTGVTHSFLTQHIYSARNWDGKV